MNKRQLNFDAIKNLRLRDSDNAFEYCGYITLSDGRFEASVAAAQKHPGVYLWVAEGRNGYEVVYAGKAKSGPKSRLSQHQAGINSHTMTAKARREEIRRIIELSESDRLSVFFRESMVERFSDIEASRYSLDEEALILTLNPVLNRSKPPVVTSGKSVIGAISDEFRFSNPQHFESWTNHLEGLSPARRSAIARNLLKMKALIGDIKWRSFDFGVTERYSSPKELAQRPVLVFGTYSGKKFTSKFALVALDCGKPDKPDVLFCLGGKQYDGYESEEFRNLRELPCRVSNALDRFQ